MSNLESIAKGFVKRFKVPVSGSFDLDSDPKLEYDADPIGSGSTRQQRWHGTFFYQRIVDFYLNI